MPSPSRPNSRRICSQIARVGNVLVVGVLYLSVGGRGRRCSSRSNVVMRAAAEQRRFCRRTTGTTKSPAQPAASGLPCWRTVTLAGRGGRSSRTAPCRCGHTPSKVMAANAAVFGHGHSSHGRAGCRCTFYRMRRERTEIAHVLLQPLALGKGCAPAAAMTSALVGGEHGGDRAGSTVGKSQSCRG